MTALLWLRRELRLHDHPALHAARRDDALIPVFCFDDRLLGGRHASGPRTQFLLECLAELDEALRARGSGLVVRRGRPERELPELARRTGATVVHLTADVSPFARRRQAAVTAALARDGVRVIAHPGVFAVDAPQDVLTGAEEPYTTFTPFHRSWLRRPRRDVLPAPRTLPGLGASPAGGPPTGELPTLAALGLRQEVPEPAPGGERAARRALRRFIDGPIDGYAEGRDLLAGDGVSRLSPYLHFGSLSARELEQRAQERTGPGGAAYRRQLCWRDFFAHVLAHFPAVVDEELQERYRGTLRWSRAPRRFEAWCEGRTGFPAVDAAMRQLRREGWMHNRARLIAGSFLSKDLGIDWRWGERWFMRLLLDGDEASNNGNWQWIASVGADPQPAFRRMFNPAVQQRRFDPDGAYVRHHVPELSEVPDEHLAEPWRMPDAVQRQANCRIGRDYPKPIVDHAAARRDALERYRDASRRGRG
ncbi:MAG TPA: deoxyribodipyrimidine photo-lyase [Solirubrobacteraceae bacterium]|nr:deoxyribodipyrimidine photo-lyase [Solirubrobacteraceae bacterium]